jgi:hypothetical protein
MKPLVERGVLTERSVRSFASQLRPMKVGELRGVRTTDGKEIPHVPAVEPAAARRVPRRTGPRR